MNENTNHSQESVLSEAIKRQILVHSDLVNLKGNVHELLAQRSRKDQTYNEFRWRARYSAQWVRRCYRQVITNRYLLSCFEKILNLFCVLLSRQQSPQLRAKVLKLMTPLMKIDRSLFNRQNIRSVVCERFNDASIMVREESIKLVGINILNEECDVGFERQGTDSLSVDSMSWYLDGLLVRLRDKGVSVRKTVVNLLMEVLYKQPWNPRYSQICQCLLEVAAMPQEEASVKDNIKTALHRIWFSSVAPGDAENAQKHYQNYMSRNGSQLNIADAIQGDCETNENHKIDNGTLSNLSYIDLAALQIVDVICRSGNDTSWLVSMIRDILYGGASLKPTEEKEETKQARMDARKHCEQLLTSLTEAMLRVEEKNEESVQRLVIAKRSGSSQIVAIVSVISAFCEVCGQASIFPVFLLSLIFYVSCRPILPFLCPTWTYCCLTSNIIPSPTLMVKVVPTIL